MHTNNKAYTLAEVLIVLVVIAFILIMMTSAPKLLPNKNKALFKKAFQTITKIAYEMVNDETLYSTESEKTGFANTEVATFLGEKYKDEGKFCQIFARMVNTINNEINCESTSAKPENGNKPSVTTADGVDFYLPITNFDTEASIYVDVNNTAPPNCFYNESSCLEPDRFEVIITPDGRMYAKGKKEKEYLEDHSIRE